MLSSGYNKSGQNKKQSGKSLKVSNLPILLSQLYIKNNSKKFKNDIKELLKQLYDSKQITELVYNNLTKAI